MLGFLALCLPIFAVIGLGLAAARFRLVAPAVVDAVGVFSFNVALPALLLRLMGSQPLGQSFQPAYFAGYLGACLALFFLLLAGAMLLGRRSRAEAAALGAAAVMGNVGYLGPPLLLPMLGERSAGPVAMAIMSEVAVVIALGSALMAPAAGRGLARAVARTLALNPVLLSIAAGATLGALAVQIPGPIDRFLQFLGAAAGPTALFALGGTLGRLRLGRRLALTAAGLSLGKLVVYPALVFVMLAWVLQLAPFWVQAGVLLAAMPTANNAFILAQRFHAAPEEVSATVLLSTLVAAVAFPITAWLLAAPVISP